MALAVHERLADELHEIPGVQDDPEAIAAILDETERSVPESLTDAKESIRILTELHEKVQVALGDKPEHEELTAWFTWITDQGINLWRLNDEALRDAHVILEAKTAAELPLRLQTGLSEHFGESDDPAKQTLKLFLWKQEAEQRLRLHDEILAAEADSRPNLQIVQPAEDAETFETPIVEPLSETDQRPEPAAPRHRKDISKSAAIRIGIGRTVAKHMLRGLRATGENARMMYGIITNDAPEVSAEAAEQKTASGEQRAQHFMRIKKFGGRVVAVAAAAKETAHELQSHTSAVRQKLGEKALHSYFTAQETLGKAAKEIAHNKKTRNRTIGAAALVGAGVAFSAYLMHNGLHWGGSGQATSDLHHGMAGNQPVSTPHEHFEIVKGQHIAPKAVTPEPKQPESFTLRHGQTIWGRLQERHPRMGDHQTHQRVARILRFNHWTWADASHLPDNTNVKLPGKD